MQWLINTDISKYMMLAAYHRSVSAAQSRKSSTTWTDDSFDILYKDGSTDCVNSDYDGHHIKRRNIASFVWTNACDSVVYGGWSINEHGVVTPSGTVQIADFGITEVEEPVSLV